VNKGVITGSMALTVKHFPNQRIYERDSSFKRERERERGRERDGKSLPLIFNIWIKD